MNQPQTTSKNTDSAPAGGARRIFISVGIRFILLLCALLIKGEIFGVSIRFILLLFLLVWSAYDFFKSDLKAKWRLKKK